MAFSAWACASVDRAAGGAFQSTCSAIALLHHTLSRCAPLLRARSSRRILAASVGALLASITLSPAVTNGLGRAILGTCPRPNATKPPRISEARPHKRLGPGEVRDGAGDLEDDESVQFGTRMILIRSRSASSLFGSIGLSIVKESQRGRLQAGMGALLCVPSSSTSDSPERNRREPPPICQQSSPRSNGKSDMPTRSKHPNFSASPVARFP
jgi:hypothetical protein